MKVFFDNCTTPRMARSLGGYLHDEPIEVAHARDLEFQKLDDIEWIQRLAASKDDWLVITGDRRLYKNKAEREALRRARLGVFVLAPAYQKTPTGRCCGFIVANWDSLSGYASKTANPIYS